MFCQSTPGSRFAADRNFGDPTITANDCFRPVSVIGIGLRGPSSCCQLTAALATMLDPVSAGPATLPYVKMFKPEAYDYPDDFSRPKHRLRRPAPDADELSAVIQLPEESKKPLLIAGGGFFTQGRWMFWMFCSTSSYSCCRDASRQRFFVWDHPSCVGQSASPVALPRNKLAEEADVVLAGRNRLRDFTTASRSLFTMKPLRLSSLTWRRLMR